MATLDLSNATAAVNLADANLVHFGTPDGATSSSWSYLTHTGDDLQIDGQNMTFDATGHAQSGTANSIAIDFGNDNTPDVLISGISADAATLDDGAASFWRVLEGNDLIIGPSAAFAGTDGEFIIFGDGIVARPGATTGGRDVIQHGDCNVSIAGDVTIVGSQSAGGAAVNYRGGNDEILGLSTGAAQSLAGDARIVNATGRLTGGNDTMLINSTSIASSAVGDAIVVEGSAGDVAEVFGGNDYIVAGIDSQATLIGDVTVQVAHSFVRGGNDRIDGSNDGDSIIGDVLRAFGNRMVGGADTLRGNGGNDVIYADALSNSFGSDVVGGSDTVYGGEGKDKIYGELQDGDFTVVSGGNDVLYGEAGDDTILGQTGNDLLDGGTGADSMIGGTGNDTYVFDNYDDRTFESAGEGIDTVQTSLSSVGLADNVENLVYIGSGAFGGSGNGLDNRIAGGVGADVIDGREGNDRLIGAAGGDNLGGQAGNDLLVGGNGGDFLRGGEGRDMASYAGSQQGVSAALDGSLTGTGDESGDAFFSIEGLTGSSFDDHLRGDAIANPIFGSAGKDTLDGLGGNDLIDGGLGADVLFGGLGNDRFRFTALNQGGDRIEDFANAPGNNDRFMFDGDAFGGLAAGRLGAARFTANAAGAATTLDQRFVYETDTGILRFDANGSAAGGVTQIATLTGAPALTLGDFQII